MAYVYTQALMDSAISYSTYRSDINNTLAAAPKDEAAIKMRPYLQNNALLMDRYDATYKPSDGLLARLAQAPATTWLVLTEGWCGDAAYNVPMMAAIEKALPEKVRLLLLLRDSYPEVMDANLTDGGRSIPKLIVLNDKLQDIGNWGPRPASLQTLMKIWKGEGIELKDLIPKVQDWYDNDNTVSLHAELETLIRSYTN